MQCHKAFDNRGEGRWDGGVGTVGNKLRLTRCIFMNIRLERAADLRGVAAELDGGASRGNFGDLKAVLRQPIGDRLNIGV